jgi:hypothetical protein
MRMPQNLRSLLLVPAVAVSLTTLSPEARAVVSYNTIDSIYNQNFDSLPITPENVSLGATSAGLGWTDDNATPGAGQYSILGWYLYHPIVQSEGGVNGNQRMRIGAGTSNTGAFMSFGLSGVTERALGGVASNTLAAAGAEMFIGVRLTNNTGATLNSFTLSYNGEQWRDGGSNTGTPVAHTLNFMWSTTATAISDPSSSFTTVPQLSFTSPVFTNLAGGAGVDGNGVGRLAIASFTVEGINWLAGTDLWLRWADVNNAGNDHGLAVDDVSFSANTIPEPGVCAALILGLTTLASRRRRAH